MKTKIRELRISFDLTQEQLSKKANISTKQLQRIETGNSNTTMKTLEKIAKALNTTVSYLIYESDAKTLKR